jgi:hypothetical protein
VASADEVSDCLMCFFTMSFNTCWLAAFSLSAWHHWTSCYQQKWQ